MAKTRRPARLTAEQKWRALKRGLAVMARTNEKSQDAAYGERWSVLYGEGRGIGACRLLMTRLSRAPRKGQRP